MVENDTVQEGADLALMEPSAPQRQADSLPPPFSPRLIFTGLGIVALFFTSFALWSFMAPLASAIVAPGVVTVDSHRKKIQHLEGGIIGAILVRDGDHVSRGQTLISLRDVRPRAQLNQLQARYFETLASIARLTAERDHKTDISFPKKLTRAKQAAAAKAAMAGQLRLFKSRQKLFADRLRVLKQKARQAKEQIKGFQGQLQAARKQLAIVGEQLADANRLLRKNLARKSQILALRRSHAELEGQVAALSGHISRTRQEILELELKMSEMRSNRVSHAMAELRRQKALAYELSQKLLNARDVQARTEIRSPIDGTVVNLQVHSPGGVIKPGQYLMEVVPSSDRLVIDARIHPRDIDEVRPGLPARIELTSLTRRDRRPISGTLKNVSADRLMDPLTKRPYYTARIHIDPASAKRQKITMMAGMGADVFIQTGERTLLDYLFAPITRTFRHGMREQ